MTSHNSVAFRKWISYHFKAFTNIYKYTQRNLIIYKIYKSRKVKHSMFVRK